MHCYGTRQSVEKVEHLVRATKNYLITNDAKGKSARFSRYYMVYFKEGDADRMKQRSPIIWWNARHASVIFTYDLRHGAKWTGQVFINSLDYYNILKILPEFGSCLWNARQSMNPDEYLSMPEIPVRGIVKNEVV